LSEINPLLIALEILNYFGELMVIDDFKDYGKFSTPDHPSPIHHWWIGELIRQGAFIGSMMVLLNELARDDDEVKSELDILLEKIKRLEGGLNVR
jgi:hypothetical protein